MENLAYLLMITGGFCILLCVCGLVVNGIYAVVGYFEGRRLSRQRRAAHVYIRGGRSW